MNFRRLPMGHSCRPGRNSLLGLQHSGRKTHEHRHLSGPDPITGRNSERNPLSIAQLSFWSDYAGCPFCSFHADWTCNYSQYSWKKNKIHVRPRRTPDFHPSATSWHPPFGSKWDAIRSGRFERVVERLRISDLWKKIALSITFFKINLLFGYFVNR